MPDERNKPPERPDIKDDGLDPVDSGHRGDNTPNGYEPNRRPDAGVGDITRSMVLGWVAMGTLLGIFSLIIIYFLYNKREAELRSQALRFTLIGIGIGLFLQIMLMQYVAGDSFGTGAAHSSSSWTSSNF